MGEVKVESHNMGPSNIQSTHIPLVPCQSGIPFLSFLNLTLKIKSQGHGWGHSSKSQCGSNIHPLTFLSFHADRPSHSWDTAYSKFDLENPVSRLMSMMLHNYRSRQFHRTLKWYKSIQRFQRHGFRKVWPKCCLIWQIFGPLASPYGTNGQITMTLHNYRSIQVHETLNEVNPSSGFRDMCSTKSGPNLWQSWQVFGQWASPYGANGQMIVHNYRPRQFHRTSNGENPSSGYRDMGSAGLAAAPPRRDRDENTPPTRRAEE